MPTYARSNSAPERNKLLLGLLALALFYAFVLTLNYALLGSLINSPFVIHPALKFVVGNPGYANTTDLTLVSLNQTFCQENMSVILRARAANAYNVYTMANTSQVFHYSLLYNSSASTFVYAVVLPPFKLLGISNVNGKQICTGYPNAFGNATMLIQAPNSSYFGPIYASMYFSRK
ncbi:MAG: hypothetical protein KGI04_04115 [Candidatus Micrarchaeota archaeon]|nr:hypothetical protein [Candidatus Micrarchaeota archaeon]